MTHPVCDLDCDLDLPPKTRSANKRKTFKGCLLKFPFLSDFYTRHRKGYCFIQSINIGLCESIIHDNSTRHIKL